MTVTLHPDDAIHVMVSLDMAATTGRDGKERSEAQGEEGCWDVMQDDVTLTSLILKIYTSYIERFIHIIFRGLYILYIEVYTTCI